MLLPYDVTLVTLTTSELLSDCFNHIRRNGFELGFVTVPHYAKSQSCVNAVSRDLRQRRAVGLRSRSLLRRAMCYSRGLQTFLFEGHISCYSTVRGPHKLLPNSPRAGHLTKCDCFRKCFCQINKFSFVIFFFLIGKMSTRAG